jgi:hypothetical protein
MSVKINSALGLISVALISLLAVGFSASAAQTQQIGFVLDINGEWFLNGKTSLHATSKLPAGGVIRASSASDRSFYIVIADLNGKIIEERECRKAGECNNPIQLPQFPGIISRIFGAVERLLGANPPRYVAPISKGDDLSEAVVKLDGSQIDLTDVFNTIEAAEYFVRFDPIIRRDSPSKAKSFGPIAFRWDPSRSRHLGVNGLKSGLYRLSIMEKHGNGFDDTGQYAWVLVSNALDYGKNTNSFGEALTLTQQWGRRVRSDVRRSFLRASLDLIAARH